MNSLITFPTGAATEENGNFSLSVQESNASKVSTRSDKEKKKTIVAVVAEYLAYLPNLPKSFDRSLRDRLERLSVPNQTRLSFFTIEVVGNEIFCRSLLLVGRVCSTLWAIPKGEALREARYLTAELIEGVAVVVLSILRIPFICSDNAPRLLKTQAWVERSIEYISGEHVLSASITSIEKQRQFLLTVHKFKNNGEISDEWLEEAVAFDRKWIISSTKSRRIARIGAWEQLTSKEINKSRLQNSLLKEFWKIAGSRAAVQEYMQDRVTYLTRLQQLSSTQTQILINVPTSLGGILEYVEKIETEISRLVITLQHQYDPSMRLGKAIFAIESKWKELSQQVFASIMKNPSKLHDIHNLGMHFFPVIDQLLQIKRIYSFYEWASQEEILNPPSFTGLDHLIATCNQLFQETEESWNTKTPICTMDEPTALRILGLSGKPTKNEIRKAFHKKALIHHPDKGGTGQTFAIVQRAHDFILEFYKL